MFAYLKVILMCIVIVWASIVAHKQGSFSFGSPPQLNSTPPEIHSLLLKKEPIDSKPVTITSHFEAFLDVLFAFNGWENATYVP